MKENYERDRFAVIFNKKDNHLEVETITEVIPTTNGMTGFERISFVVKSGKYSGKTDADFNYLRGDQGKCSFLNDDSMLVSDKKEDVPSIYIFNNDFIDELQNKNLLTRIDAYIYILKGIYNTELELEGHNNDLAFDVYKTRKIEKENVYTREVIDKLLNENVVDQDLVRKSRKINDYGVAVVPLMPVPIFITRPEEDISEDDYDARPIDIKTLINEVNNKIVGQEEAVRTLVTNIYYNKKLIEYFDENHIFDEAELDSRKSTILVDGSTGTGKTAIVKDIAAKLEIPLVIANANSFSETGYVGPTITDLLAKLLRQTDGRLLEAERGIIVLDEIDKIAANFDHGRDMKRGVQEELLSFIGGGKYDVSVGNHKVSFDTSKITFILMGAFTHIKDKKIKENESNKIGFDTSDTMKERTYTVTPQDYIDYGIMREFFGRIKVITSTKTYTKEDLKNILLNSSISPLKNFDKTVKLFGYNELTYSDELIDKIVDEAYNMETGARGLQTVVSGIQNLLLYDLETGLETMGNIVELSPNILDKYKEKNLRKY